MNKYSKLAILLLVASMLGFGLANLLDEDYVVCTLYCLMRMLLSKSLED